MIIWIALAFAAGLVVGWNFLPQPKWISDIFADWSK